MKTMYVTLLLVFVVGATAVFLLTSQQGTAAEATPEQQRLQTILLPEAADLLIQDTLILDAGDNGFVDEQGQDIVRNYLSGVRADYMLPLSVQPSLSQEATNELARQGVQAHVASFVYRFSDAAAAATESERLRQTRFVGLMALEEKSQDPTALVFTFDASAAAPQVTTTWLVTQQGALLTVVTLPGLLQPPSLSSSLHEEAALPLPNEWELQPEAVAEPFRLVYNEAVALLLTTIFDSLTAPVVD